nr:MAG TPA: hypothetical protein [Caudoviricetes sp.]DAZ64175.1 MAG TPA: hypothetical protein [Caudoviricetes sp.]DAZ84373.1 MAG TPA: hypothetical protein [Caudoviricetes sp.]
MHRFQNLLLFSNNYKRILGHQHRLKHETALLPFLRIVLRNCQKTQNLPPVLVQDDKVLPLEQKHLKSSTTCALIKIPSSIGRTN